MNDEVKAHAQLVVELPPLPQHGVKLETVEVERNWAKQALKERKKELKRANGDLPTLNTNAASGGQSLWRIQDLPRLTVIGDEVGLGIANAQLFAAVQQQGQQLRALGMRLVEAEEAERRRLACELHDQVGQNLTAMNINLDIIRTLLPADIPAEIIARLEDTRALVTQTTKQVRRVMVDLRPETLDDYGILAALRWSAQRFTQRTEIAVVVEGEETDSRLSMQIENVLYRVAQEALTNVAKHAQATQVTVSLKMDSETVYLTIADNGVGFTLDRRTASDQEQHWGLALMAERVEEVGGRFRLESCPGHGTRVIVEMPR